MNRDGHKPGTHNDRPPAAPPPMATPIGPPPVEPIVTGERRPGRRNDPPPTSTDPGRGLARPAPLPPPRTPTAEQALAAWRGGDRMSGRRNEPPPAHLPPSRAVARVTPEELAAATIELSRRGGGHVRRRLFVPNNPALYNAAFSGFVSGCNQARTIGSSTTGLVAQAVLLAQAVDSLIATDGALNQSKVDLLTSLVSNVFGEQYPQGLTEGQYGPTAAEIVALYEEAILLLASIPPVGGGSPYKLIYQPGGVTSGNVYATDAEIAAALVAVNGAADVYVDPSLGAPVLSAGVTWDFNGCGTLQLWGDTNTPNLTVEDTGHLEGLTRLVNVRAICKCTTVPSFTWASFAETPEFAIDGGIVELDPMATVSPIQVSAGGFLFVQIDNEGGFDANANVTAFVELATGASLFLNAFQINQGAATLPTTLVSGDGTTSLLYAGDGSAFPAPTFSLFSGTLTYTPLTGPFTQAGVVGTVIGPVDATAPFEVSGGTATGSLSQGLVGTAQDPNDFASGGGIAGTGSGAGYNTALRGGTAGSATGSDVAIGFNSATGGDSVAIGGDGNAAGGLYSACFGGANNYGRWSGGCCVGGYILRVRTQRTRPAWAGMRTRADGLSSACVGGGTPFGPIFSPNHAVGNFSVCLGGGGQTNNADACVSFGAVITVAGRDDGALATSGISGGGQVSACTIAYCASQDFLSGSVMGPLENNFNDMRTIAIPEGTASRIHVKAIAVTNNGAATAEWDYRILVTCPPGGGGIVTIAASTDPGTYLPELFTVDGAGESTWTLTPTVTGADNIVTLTFNNHGSSTSSDTTCLAQLDLVSGQNQ